MTVDRALSSMVMRPVVLLPLVCSCQLVFSVDAPPIERGAKFVARSNTALVVLTRTDAVEDDDLVIVTIQSASSFPAFTAGPPDFVLLSDGTDMCGTANWHLWTFAGKFGSASTLEFTFDIESDYDAIATAYKNADGATELGFMKPLQMAVEHTISLPAVDGLSAGTFGWVALVGNVPVEGEPAGLERVGELDNIAIYDAVTVGGAIPQIDVTIPATFCLGVSQVKIEP
jgi:hypothetical protein